jgi:high-affinity Fe2+/Pb2+ permease
MKNWIKSLFGANEDNASAATVGFFISLGVLVILAIVTTFTNHKVTTDIFNGIKGVVIWIGTLVFGNHGVTSLSSALTSSSADASTNTPTTTV